MLRMPIRNGRFACFLSAILLLTLLASSSVYALSTACSALNMVNPATFSRMYAAADFDAGESVHITLTDNGLDPKTDQTKSGSVIMRSSSLTLYSEYRTFSGSAGTYTLDASASQITSNGLFLGVNNNYGYLNDITISCSAAATVSSDATLSSLSLSEGTLTPGFSSGITNYSTRVANGVTSTTVTPTTSNIAAHVRVNGNSLNSGSGYSVPLVVGTNSINVVVTAEDGTSTANYLVQVERLEPTPIAGSSSLNVAFNSNNNPISLPITGGTPNSLTISTSPAHGTLSVVDVSHVTYTPAANYVGSDSFTYTSSNSAGSSATGTISVTVSPPTLVIAPGALPAATLNTPYSQTFSASGGSGNYSFSMSGLSTGLTLSPAGVLSGMPATAGSFSFTVIVTDTITNSSAQQAYTLNVALSGQPPVANTVTSNVVANSGENTIEPLISGGAATNIDILQQPVHGSARVLNSRILYQPVAGFSGSDSLIYSASNSFGTTQATVTLNVTAAVISFTPAAGALPQAVVGNAYAQNFSATGGVAPYSYHLQGTIPGGMTFTNGSLGGTPGTVSDAAFTLIATDANGATGQAAYTLKVSAAQPVGVDHKASVVAGGVVRVSLTENARGGPFSAARLVAQPDSVLGSASISASDNDYQLIFQAAPQASGSVALRYVLNNGSTESAAATVTITIAGRPYPAQNP
uniref:Ig-like domain-containing protein n=1 Tax=Pantoea sp. CTOTU49201 TaxID=2953855 RepID=UPI00289DFD23